MTQQEFIQQIKKNVYFTKLQFEANCLEDFSDCLKEISIKAIENPNELSSNDIIVLGMIATQYEDVVFQIGQLD